MKKSFNRASGALTALLMAAGILVVGSTAQAQYRQYPDGRVRRENRDRRYDRRDRDGDGDYDRRDEYIREQQRRERQAQRNNGYYGGYGNSGRYGGYGNYGSYNQAAMNQGYQDGLNTGASDAQHGQNYSPQRSHYYKNAPSQAFRDGFTQGYDQGYRQYGGYNNGRYRTGSGIGNILGGIFGRP